MQQGAAAIKLDGTPSLAASPKLQQNANEGCNSCPLSLAGDFLHVLILVVIGVLVCLGRRMSWWQTSEADDMRWMSLARHAGA